MKETADSNASSAKLFTEKAELQSRYDTLIKESKCMPDSMQAQMRSLNEMMENLNQYLKMYNEEAKKEAEDELSKKKLEYAEKMEDMNEEI